MNTLASDERGVDYMTLGERRRDLTVGCGAKCGVGVGRIPVGRGKRPSKASHAPGTALTD